MKEQINKLARGEFTYSIPVMAISEENIQLNIAVNDYCTRQLTITGTSEIRGIVYSTSNRVSVHNSEFFGMTNDITYIIDSSAMTVGDVILGQFHIVSNAREVTIPYRIKVIDKSIETSMGKVNNLFHLANLAQVEPDEAEKVFLSEDFCKIFLKNDISLQNIYHTLVQSAETRNGIEEFLIAVRKKSQIVLKLSYQNKVYDSFTENFKDIVYLSKNTWGYVELKIYTDAAFIKLPVDKISSRDFTGNRFELEYVIDKSNLHYGKNYGRITVESSTQVLQCEIEVHNYSIHVTQESTVNVDYKEKHKATFLLTTEYMNFRTKKIDVKEWAERSNKILDRIRGIDDSNISLKLAQAQIYFIQHRSDDGQWLLGNVRDDIMQNKEDITLYCYYLYVNSLAKKDSEYSKEVFDIVKKYYDNGYDNWQLLWIMFYISEDYDKNKSIKLTRIKEQFHKGCKSPIMYLEACNIINLQPMLIRVLNEFEMQVINFGCKYDLISDKTSAQICDIVNSGKIAPRIYLRILNSLYYKFDDDEILNILCTHMIRNEMAGSQYFAIYEKSVLRGLRITRLYEFYIESADLHDMRQFPKRVLMYFNYNSQLTFERRAYLYANIICNKERDKETYESYRKQIELFALEQIRVEHMNDNLSIVYQHIQDKSIVTIDTAKFIGKILFTYKITAYNSGMSYVIVKHKEILKEERIPLVHDTAYIQMYTDNCTIVFEDMYGDRRKDSVQYELEKMFEDMSLVDDVYGVDNDNLYLVLYFCEKNMKYQKYTIESLKLQNYLLRSEAVDKSFKQELTGVIIDYYYSEYVGDEFRSYFLDIEKADLSEINATKLIEACIVQGMYEDAYDLTLIYGYEKVLPKRLFKMLRRIIEITNSEYNEFVIAMCQYVFANRKYDDVILEYMVSGFNGSNSQMIDIWQACVDFNVESYELEERIIAQMLFTTDNSKPLINVFKKYYDRGAKDRIVEGFLAFNAYSYFVKEAEINEEIFEILELRMKYEYDVTAVCKLAMLKYYSELEELNQEQLDMAQIIVNDMCRNNKIFAFFKKFEPKFSLPYNVLDKTIIEYRTNPDNKVVIHYIVNGENHMDNYSSENMKNTFEGIFTKKFTMFYGDNLQYYITEISNGETITTDHSNVIYNNINLDETDGRFDYINDMLASKELHDMATLKKLMHGYSVENYVTQQLFKPL